MSAFLPYEISPKLRQLVQNKHYPDCLEVKLLCKTSQSLKKIKFGTIVAEQSYYDQWNKEHLITIIANLGSVREMLKDRGQNSLNQATFKVNRIAFSKLDLQAVIPPKSKL